MLSRLIPKPSHFRRFISLPSKQSHFPNSPINPIFTIFPKPFSAGNNNNNNKGNGNDPFSSDVWKNFGGSDEKFDAFFAEESGSLDGVNDAEGSGGRTVKKEVGEEQWWLEEKGLDNEDEDAIFKGIDKETEENGSSGVDFGSHLGAGNLDEPWKLKGEEEEDKGDIFDFAEAEVSQEVGELNLAGGEVKEDVEKLEKEEQALTAILKG